MTDALALYMSGMIKREVFRDHRDFLANGDDWLISSLGFPLAVLVDLFIELGPVLDRLTWQNRSITVQTQVANSPLWHFDCNWYDLIIEWELYNSDKFFWLGIIFAVPFFSFERHFTFIVNRPHWTWSLVLTLCGQSCPWYTICLLTILYHSWQ